MTFRAILAWSMFIASTVAEPVCMLLWYYNKINEEQMVGVTLLLSLLAGSFVIFGIGMGADLLRWTWASLDCRQNSWRVGSLVWVNCGRFVAWAGRLWAACMWSG